MSLVHADNFSIYGTTTSNLSSGVYTVDDGALSLVTDPDTVSSGYVIKFQPNGGVGGGAIRYVLQAGATTEVGVSHRVWLPALPIANSQRAWLVRFHDSANRMITGIQVLTTGALAVVSYSDSSTTNSYTILDQTSNPVISAQGWYHIETKFTSGTGSTGAIEIRVEGKTVLEGSTYNFQNSSACYQIVHRCTSDGTGASTTFCMKDYVVWDTSGSYNNDFLGSVLVAELAPASDVSLNWTPSSGTTGYNILNVSSPSNTSYISAPYSTDEPHYPDAYVATLSSLPIETTSVKGLVTYVRAAKSDGGDGTLQAGLITDNDTTPVTTLGEDRSITVAQTYWMDVFEEDPSTSAAWLVADVNALHFQLNRTT